MTVSGRNKTIANGSSRPEAVIQVSCRERPLPDRKAVVRVPRSVRKLIDHEVLTSRANDA